MKWSRLSPTSFWVDCQALGARFEILPDSNQENYRKEKEKNGSVVGGLHGKRGRGFVARRRRLQRTP